MYEMMLQISFGHEWTNQSVIERCDEYPLNTQFVRPKMQCFRLFIYASEFIVDQ